MSHIPSVSVPISKPQLLAMLLREVARARYLNYVLYEADKDLSERLEPHFAEIARLAQKRAKNRSASQSRVARALAAIKPPSVRVR